MKPFAISRRASNIAGFIVTLLGLSACGQGDGKEPVPGTPQPPQPPSVGMLVDGPVAGVSYETSGGLSGVTNAAGQFEYNQLETITFSIGGIVLGTALGTDIISSVELMGADDAVDQAVVNQLVFLQSIDEDGDPSNGISVSSSAAATAANLSLDFNGGSFAAQVQNVVNTMMGAGSTVVSDTDALYHFYQTYVEFGGSDTFSFDFTGFAPAGNGVAYNLVFADDFENGDTPDPGKWNMETGYGDGGWGNNEWQLYTASPDNVRVDDGNLIIQARCDEPCGVRDDSVTSARINTQDKFSFKYGRVIARIKPPVGEAAWPAFWSLGASFSEIGWPRSGEIDFMEMHNAMSNEFTTHSTMHWCDQTRQAPDVCSFPEGWVFNSQSRSFPSSLGDDFHVWEAEWNEDSVAMFIDGEQYFNLTIDPFTMEEFLEEFFLILNVAMGGTLGSNSQPPSGNEIWPQTMLVDYVRVFQRTDNPSSQGFAIDFEEDPASYDFGESGGFGGGAAAVIDNPVAEGINTSAQVGRMLKFPGDVFGGSRLNLASALSIASGSSFTMKVWSPRPVMVLLKLEGPNEVERNVAHTGSGWEELTFNYGNFSGQVDGITLIFDLGIVGDATNDPDNWTFYFDDIELLDNGEDDDITAPTLTSVNIASDNSDPMSAKSGDTITLSFTANEDLMTPSVSIAGSAAGQVTGSGTQWQATRTLGIEDAEGAVTFTIDFTDTAENMGVTVSTTTDESLVTYDRTAPTVTITGLPDNFTSLVPILVTFDFSEPVIGFELTDLTVSNATVADLLVVDADSFSVNVIPSGGGDISIGVNSAVVTDVAGNANVDSAAVVSAIDTIAPMLTFVSIASDNANDQFAMSGDMVVVSFESNEPLLPPTVQINGAAASVNNVGGSNTIWQASFTITPDDDEGEISFNISFTDLLGNVGAPIAATSNNSTVTVDLSTPNISLSIASNNENAGLATVSDTVTLSISADEVINEPVVTIGGLEADSVTTSVNNSWSATRTITEGEADGPLGVAVQITDLAGNAVTATSISDGTEVVLDLTAPNGAFLDVPNEFTDLSPVTMTVQFDEAVVDFDVSDIDVEYGGNVMFDSVDALTYEVTVTPTGVGGLTITIAPGAVSDLAGNPSEVSVDAVVPANLDPDAPLLTSVNMISDNLINSQYATTGNVVTLTFTASENIEETPNVMIAGFDADSVTGADTDWVATRVMQTGDAEGMIAFAVNFTDLDGDAGPQTTTTTDGSTVTFDVSRPVADIQAPAMVSSLEPFSIEIVFDEPVTGFEMSDVLATHATVSMFTDVDQMIYGAMVTPDGNGSITLSIPAGAATNFVGLPSVAVNDVIVEFLDNGPPELTAVSISSSNDVNDQYAMEGDVVTVRFTPSESLQLPIVTVAGQAVDQVVSNGGDWEAIRVMGVNDAEGEVSFTIDFEDLTGDVGMQVTQTTDSSSVIYDVTSPTVRIIGLPGTFDTVDAISLTLTFTEEVVGFEASDIDITNGMLTNFSIGTATSYLAEVTPTENGNLMVAIAPASATDMAGNANEAAEETAIANFPPVWSLIWEDDFDGVGLDATNWTARTDVDCPAPCLGQQQYTTNNVSVTDGVLSITVDGGGGTYTSGLIDTRGKWDISYGRIEIDAQLPASAGVAPALVMLPTDDHYGSWPLSGQIDIATATDLGVAGNNATEHSLHYGLPVPENTVTGDSYTGSMSPDADFVTYAIEWEEEEIRWFIDDNLVDEQHIQTQTFDHWYTYSEDEDGIYEVAAGAAPFDQDFYLALGVMVNDNAGSSSNLPQQLNIEAVRVYECANAIDPLAGTGCSTGDSTETPIDAPSEPYRQTLELYTSGLDAVTLDTNAGMFTNMLQDGFAVNPAGLPIITNLAASDNGNTIWNVSASASGAGNFAEVFIGSEDLIIDPVLATGFDLSGSETASELLFDLRVNSISAGTQLIARLDSREGDWGQYALPLPEDNDWHPYSVKIADLLANQSGSGLDLSSVRNLFALRIENGAADIDLDNIRVQIACREAANCTPALLFKENFYTQDFEKMDPTEANALIDDDWLGFANVFSGVTGGFLYPYSFSPPTTTGFISGIVTDQGGDAQGERQLVIFNDYDNDDHMDSNFIEINVFQERIITIEDVGKTVSFSFDAKRGNINEGTCDDSPNPPCNSTALAFIKTIDPNTGFSQTNFVNVDTTNLPITWNRYGMELFIDGGLVGQLLQFGFSNTATDYEPSGVFYDNIVVSK